VAVIHPDYDDNIPADLKERAIQEFEQATKVPPINPNDPCQYEFEEQTVFICMDMEWMETHSLAITEIGFAYLDTNDLVGLHPGKDGINWHDKIRTRHFRVNEYRHHVNHQFVTGCPDGFNFGESEFVSLEDAGKIASACFRPPFHPFRPVAQILAECGITSTTELRKVIFVGHDPRGDIDALRRLKVNIYNTPGLLEIINTNHIWNVWMRERQGKRLETILKYFGQDTPNTHNAGNDARYTIQALLAMVVRHAELRQTQSLEAERNALLQMRKDTMAASAFEALEEDMEGWKTDLNSQDPRQLKKEIDGGPSEF
jgi:hypothetical protein